MHIDSVRELKHKLHSTVLAALAAPTHLRMLGGAARSIDVPAHAGTIALGVTHRGKGDYALAVRIQHRALEHSVHVDRIHKHARGEVDVRYIGRVFKQAQGPWYQRENRPLHLGCSVGHFKVTAGTLGAFVRSRSGGPILILSNNHVLANENHCQKGDPIVQPAPFPDFGEPKMDTVARLLTFVRLVHRGHNVVDCAVAALAKRIDYDPRKLTGLGKLAGIVDGAVEKGTRVSKVGRTSGLTHGRVTAFEIDNVAVRYDTGHFRFDDQIEIEGIGHAPFSHGGDSGALVVDAARRALGLLFAGSDQGGANGQGISYATPLHTVCERLNVDLVY